jgi:predicted anti-sigma-YlaC factor YlaD
MNSNREVSVMWRLTNKIAKECQLTQDALERSSSRAAEVLAFPESVRTHLASCGDCRIIAAELVEVRGMLRTELAGPQPGPFFLTRVMASIAEREVESEKRSQIWAAVPHLASRLTLIASLTLLVAGSWLYQPPSHKAATSGVSAEQSSEGLVEGSAVTIQDDFLLSSPE